MRPVAPLDPWEAMAAAVHRTGDEREEWNAAETITVAQALAASVDGAPTVGVGSLADLVLLDADPLCRRGERGRRAPRTCGRSRSPRRSSPDGSCSASY